MILLKNLESLINTISKSDWRKLFNLISEIEQTKKFGEMVESKKSADGSMGFPYWNNSLIVTKFFDVIQELNIVPEFDWTNWNKGNEILNSLEQDFEKLTSVTLCKLLTAIVRQDRFFTGFLISNFDNGIILKIIKSLERNFSFN